MKRLVAGAVLAGGAAFALRRLTRDGRRMHERCRAMMAECQGAR